MPDFLSEARSLFEYMRALRRDFHQHPELGFSEHRTAGIVAEELKTLGLNVRSGVGGTGVVSTIEGKNNGKVLLLRADMDALPIVEETNVPYASQTKGIMHACGHDGHMAILLAVARILNNHRNEFSGTVKVVFQPAEEGMGGAEKMIEAGILENPRVDFALALHMWNEKQIGWIGIPDGPAMAGGEILKITLTGKGGHGAIPHQAVDPILAGAQVITALQSVVSRNVNPLRSAVVSICTIHGGETFNVIPPSLEMTGTIRTFESEIRSQVLTRCESVTRAIADAMGCDVNIDTKPLTPAVINYAPLSEMVRKVAHSILPTVHIDASNYATMGSEDMAFIMEKVPGCFFFIGSANTEKGLDAGHHNPKFDFDEEALIHGAAVMSASVMEILKKQ